MYSGARREDPADLPCFKACMACLRCEDKGKYAKCNHCSGRRDPGLRKDPYDIDDHCSCKEGILRIRTSKGKLLIRKYPSNPFEGSVAQEQKTQDEVDYEAHVAEMREKLDDPTYDPVQITEE